MRGAEAAGISFRLCSSHTHARLRPSCQINITGLQWAPALSLPDKNTINMSQRPTQLYICETCRFSEEHQEIDGKRGGEQLLTLMEPHQAALADHGITLRSTRCLMACKRHCTVHIRAPGKTAYVIGDMRPDQTSVETLLDYAQKYSQSEDGTVPYKTWPEGIKGHFVARVPPLDADS